jgi:excisionase family DNA binding protein
VEEAATYLNISKHTVRKWRSQGRLPYIPLGDRILFRRADLDELVEQNLVQARYKPGGAV